MLREPPGTIERRFILIQADAICFRNARDGIFPERCIGKCIARVRIPEDADRKLPLGGVFKDSSKCQQRKAVPDAPAPDGNPAVLPSASSMRFSRWQAMVRFRRKRRAGQDQSRFPGSCQIRGQHFSSRDGSTFRLPANASGTKAFRSSAFIPAGRARECDSCSSRAMANASAGYL